MQLYLNIVEYLKNIKQEQDSRRVVELRPVSFGLHGCFCGNFGCQAVGYRIEIISVHCRLSCTEVLTRILKTNLSSVLSYSSGNPLFPSPRPAQFASPDSSPASQTEQLDR